MANHVADEEPTLFRFDDVPANRASAAYRTACRYWMHLAEDAEVARRMGDEQMYELYATAAQHAEAIVRAFKDRGFGGLQPDERRALAGRVTLL